MSEIHRENREKIEIPENPTLENMWTLFEKMKTIIKNLSWKEKFIFKKDDSPIFQKLVEMHKFCDTRSKKEKEWIHLAGMFGILTEKFPILCFRRFWKNEMTRD